MTYEEFEWHILRMVYEEGLERLQPAFLAYALGLPHETVRGHLEHAVELGLLDLELDDEGTINYLVPGLEGGARLPTPPWKLEQEKERRAAEAAERHRDKQTGTDGIAGAREEAPDSGPGVERSQALMRRPRPGEKRPRRVADGTDGSVQMGSARKPIPANLRGYIEDNYSDADGSVAYRVAPRSASASAQVVHERGARPDTGMPASQSLVPYNPSDTGLLRVEASEDAFCDPSQTIFMRQIRVFGVESEEQLRDNVQRLFEGFGYRLVQNTGERQRYERGSVTFILALVPLFVLVVPLFIYLFLYTMGRSTIHQEPLELDVQFRKSSTHEQCYEIDLTFIGLHGVVLGAADQRVLNQEVDTLREELRWALSSV